MKTHLKTTILSEFKAMPGPFLLPEGVKKNDLGFGTTCQEDSFISR
jgi:hypothetical protein